MLNSYKNFKQSLRLENLPVFSEIWTRAQSVTFVLNARDFFLTENSVQKRNEYFRQKDIPWLTNTYYGNLFIESVFREIDPSFADQVFLKFNVMDIEDFFKKKAHKESLKKATQAPNSLEILPKLFQERVESCHLKGFSYVLNADISDHRGSFLLTATVEDLENIYYATATGNLPLMQLFLEKGSRVLSVAASRIVYVAADFNQLQCLRWMKDQGVILSPFDEITRRSMLLFIKKGNIEGLEILETMGANLSVNSKFQNVNPLWSPLHYATKDNQVDLALWLIEKRGMDPKARTLDGKTPHTIVEEKTASEAFAFFNTAYPLSEEEKKLTLFEACSQKSFNVISLIFGTKKGERVFVVGRRRAETQEGRPVWKLPGGAVDPQDPTISEAALREGEEETGLPLLRLFREGRISAQKILEDTIVVGDQGSEISFVVVDGVNFDVHPPYANDDLDMVKVVPVSEFEDKGGENLWKRYGHKGEPIRGSNGHVIQYALGLQAEAKDPKLREFLSYENFGNLLMKQVLASGRLEEIQRLQAFGVSLEGTAPLQVAYHHNHGHLLKYFKEQGLSSLEESYRVCKLSMEEDKRDAFELLFDPAFNDYQIADLYKASFKFGFFREKLVSVLKERKLMNRIFPSFTDSNGMMIVQYGIESPLVTAANDGQHDALEQLLKEGVDPDGEVFFEKVPVPIGYHHMIQAYFFVESPLLVAILEGHAACVRTLLKHASPNVTSQLRRDDFVSSMRTHPSQKNNLRDVSARVAYFLSLLSNLDVFYWDNIPALFLAAISELLTS